MELYDNADMFGELCEPIIGWGLDYSILETWGMEERGHKRFLNDYFSGRIEWSESRGELYNEDLTLGDARFCGTTAIYVWNRSCDL